MVSKKKSDWPPSGWKVEINVRNGRKIKCYINAKTRQKLYSKLAVLRHIRNGIPGNQRSHATKGHAEKSSGKKQMHLVEENDLPEWLPAGWIIELRTRKSGPKEGSKYKCFIEPSTGSTFFSKPEVSRYLESIQGGVGSSGQKQTGSSRHSSSKVKSNLDPNLSKISKTRLKKSFSSRNTKVVTERTTDEELPSGWIKEMKIKMIGNAVVRRDPFYFDPASGLVFRSKLEAIRFVETGEISRHAYRRKSGRSIIRDECVTEKTSPTPSGKREKTTKNGPRKQLFSGEGSLNQSISALPEASDSAGVKRITRSSSRGKPDSVGEASLEQSAFLPAQAQAHMAQKVTATKEAKRTNKRALPKAHDDDRKENHATPLIEVKPDIVPFQDPKNGKSQTNNRKAKDRKPPSLPSRSSKRLAGVNPEVVFHPIPIEHILRATRQKPSKTRATPSPGLIPNVTHEKLIPLAVDKQNVLATQEESSNKVDSLTRENLQNPNVEVYPTKTEKSSGYPPTTEEKPVTEQSESQFCFPSPLWSDPCLEFAFKTLTGAMPLDDNLAIEDYIQHQLRTSKESNNTRSLPDMNDGLKPVSPLPEEGSFLDLNGFGSQKSSR